MYRKREENEGENQMAKKQDKYRIELQKKECKREDGLNACVFVNVLGEQRVAVKFWDKLNTLDY